MLGTVPRVKCSGAQRPMSPEGKPDKKKEAGKGDRHIQREILGGGLEAGAGQLGSPPCSQIRVPPIVAPFCISSLRPSGSWTTGIYPHKL